MFSASENVQNNMWTQVSKSFEKTLDLTYVIFRPGISIQYSNKKRSRSITGVIPIASRQDTVPSLRVRGTMPPRRRLHA